MTALLVLLRVSPVRVAGDAVVQPPANPGALVLLHGASQRQKSVNTFYSGGGYGGYGYRGGWGGMGGMAARTPLDRHADRSTGRPGELTRR
jgi:hypothetical protein